MFVHGDLYGKNLRFTGCKEKQPLS